MKNYSFYGFFINRNEDYKKIKIEGEFNTLSKNGFTVDNDLILASIIFTKDKILNCRVSSNILHLKDEAVNFVFDRQDHCFVAEVFVKNNARIFLSEVKKEDNLIDKNSTSKTEIGVMILYVHDKDIQNYEHVKDKLFLLTRTTRDTVFS
ncbi:MAG: hypothetical protein KBD12_00710 [Candidatus Pacebacteria bacterium]|nr:hypothetical protein [Candidatus Paceibacterota bacterium]